MSDRQTDRQTDGNAMPIERCSISYLRCSAAKIQDTIAWFAI